MKSMSHLAVCWTDTSTKPTRLYIATARNYAITSDKFKSDNLYLIPRKTIKIIANNIITNADTAIVNANVQCLNKEIHFGL